MARRRGGRPGSYLVADDLTGFTRWNNEVRTGYYKEVAVKPYKRNLQEIATGLYDPEAVPLIRQQQYEVTPTCVAATAPIYVGNTTVRTNLNNPAVQALGLDPGIGDMEVGCSFIVR